MITFTFTRTELERLFREGGAIAAFPEETVISPELASALADIILEHVLGGVCL